MGEGNGFNSIKPIKIRTLYYYITSIARTVEVRKNGSPTQNQAGFTANKIIVRIKETADIAQYKPLDLFVSLIL